MIEKEDAREASEQEYEGEEASLLGVDGDRMYPVTPVGVTGGRPGSICPRCMSTSFSS